MSLSLLLSILADDIVPIFLAASVGFVLARRWHVDVRSVSRVTFNGLAPFLIFHLLTTTTVSASEAGQVALFTVLLVFGIGAVARIVAIPLRLSRPELAAFLIVVMFSNAGNYGMSVVLFAFGREHLARAAIYFVTSAVLMYTAGIVIASSGRQSLGQALRGLLKVPALYGVCAAVVVTGTGLALPVAILRPVELLADAAIPTMLLVLGMQLERGAWPSRPGLVAAAAALALVAAPTLGYALTQVVGLSGPARQAVIVQSGMPSAVITTILALEFDVAPAFVTAVVLATTVLSPLSVTVLIALAQSMP